MADPFDPARYVPEAAAAAMLTIAPADLGDVTQAFAVLARVAAQIMTMPLPEETIAAAVFLPDDGASR